MIIRPEPSNRTTGPVELKWSKTCTYLLESGVFSVCVCVCERERERSQGVTPCSQWSYPFFLSGVSYYVIIATHTHTHSILNCKDTVLLNAIRVVYD